MVNLARSRSSRTPGLQRLFFFHSILCLYSSRLAEGHIHRSLGQRPRIERERRSLAEGHIQRCNVAASVSMAFGQKADANNNPWGDTPGYDEYGLRPLRPLYTCLCFAQDSPSRIPQPRRALAHSVVYSRFTTAFIVFLMVLVS
jgi:hypothetical protein